MGVVIYHGNKKQLDTLCRDQGATEDVTDAARMSKVLEKIRKKVQRMGMGPAAMANGSGAATQLLSTAQANVH